MGDGCTSRAHPPTQSVHTLHRQIYDCWCRPLVLMCYPLLAGETVGPGEHGWSTVYDDVQLFSVIEDYGMERVVFVLI